MAWVHPSGIVALPTPYAGWWYAADILDNVFLVDAATEDGVIDFALERGANPERAFWVQSIPYLFNPWPVLDQLYEERGTGRGPWVPDWIDRAPFNELEVAAARL